MNINSLNTRCKQKETERKYLQQNCLTIPVSRISFFCFFSFEMGRNGDWLVTIHTEHALALLSDKANLRLIICRMSHVTITWARQSCAVKWNSMCLSTMGSVTNPQMIRIGMRTEGSGTSCRKPVSHVHNPGRRWDQLNVVSGRSLFSPR